MPYTVKQLAEISGVSIRTLHFYDEIGLLRPAWLAKNGYRYYQENELLRLQQILFFRELGFELKGIKAILDQPDFDRVGALQVHKFSLLRKKKRMAGLIETIDKTIMKLHGETHMNDKEMYQGFAPQEQADHESYLVNRFGEKARKHIEQSKNNTKGWTQREWGAMSDEWKDILLELKKLMEENALPSSVEAQVLIKKHYLWLSKIWTPDKESYPAHVRGFIEYSWHKVFAPFDNEHPRLAKYFAEAAEFFAQNNLK